VCIDITWCLRLVQTALLTASVQMQRAMASNKNGAVMEEAFLSRFDGLPVRVRKVLQTCAVLGLSFALSDVIRVHPELQEVVIENALGSAVDEMVLIEQVEEDEDFDDAVSAKSNCTGESGESADRSEQWGGSKALGDRFFQFSHAMWRKNVLTTMLKERKIELHRSIAEAMERDQVLIMEQSDISRLLTLFDHWKSCGDFSKSAPLALAVGSRLEEWDLSAQSLELYEDALEMSFDSVQVTANKGQSSDEWVEVSAKPGVWDLILRLHIRIGLCYQHLGDDYESISYFEDAFTIIKSSSKIPGMSKSLMMPILSTLAVLKLEHEAEDSQTKKDQEKLLKTFVSEASKSGNPVHNGRALSMEATYFAKLGLLDRALEDVEKLRSSYDIMKHSPDMIAEYGRDFGLECISQSIQWLYLKEDHEEAEKQADLFIQNYLPILVNGDTDNMMYGIFPILHVLMLLDRANDADWLLKKYAINPYHDSGSGECIWITMFNPLAYLLEVIMMEDAEETDWELLKEMAEWVLDEENGEFDLDLERKAHTIMGELCWRLANFKEEDDPSRDVLLERAKDLLSPVAHYPHPEIFLKHSAQALLKAC
jgi:tetratricopeptide (TPR) repeat protein